MKKKMSLDEQRILALLPESNAGQIVATQFGNRKAKALPLSTINGDIKGVKLELRMEKDPIKRLRKFTPINGQMCANYDDVNTFMVMKHNTTDMNIIRKKSKLIRDAKKVCIKK